VPETSQQAQAALAVPDGAWQQDGEHFWAPATQAPTGERWVVVRTTQGEDQAPAALRRKVAQARTDWERQLWHLSNRRFACQSDAQAALAQQLKGRPEWLEVQTQLVAHPRHGRPGRPRQGAEPARQGWQLVAKVCVNETKVAHQVRHHASFLVATNVTDPHELPDHTPIQTCQDQGSVERGFAFLKDPLFLASSVFVKKPERIVALALVMVLCLLVYRLAEHRLREQLAATRQTIPSQVNKPTDRPTLRWVFQCFEGVDLLHIRHGPDPALAVVLRLEPLHQQVLALLGPAYTEIYKSTN
jgi:transposase